MKRSPLKRATPLRAKPANWPTRSDAPPLPRNDRQHEALTGNYRAPRALMAMVSQIPAPAQPKDGRYISEAWRRNVAALPCVYCGAASQAAHRNEGKGMGLKTDDCLTAALCPPCHSEIDQGPNLTRDERRARIDRAIVLTLRELVRAGKVSAA